MPLGKVHELAFLCVWFALESARKMGLGSFAGVALDMEFILRGDQESLQATRQDSSPRPWWCATELPSLNRDFYRERGNRALEIGF